MACGEHDCQSETMMPHKGMHCLRDKVFRLIGIRLLIDTSRRYPFANQVRAPAAYASVATFSVGMMTG